MLPDFRTLITRPVQLLALGFGSGLAPKAPGTFGTLAAIPVFFLLLLLPLWAYIVVTLAATWVGVFICQSTADDFKVHDHPAIVWDEFVGLWIALLPLVLLGFAWHWLICGFLLFRFFDILKPWPIRWVDKHVHGGLGIMLDDVLAGLGAALCLYLVMTLV